MNPPRGLVDRRTALAGAAAALAPLPSRAQTADRFPSRPITFVIPSSPGGVAEGMIRVIGDAFQRKYGQALLVDYRPGAMGTVGAASVAHAPPDGYTLLASPNSPIVFLPLTHTFMPYDPLALTLITMLSIQPIALAVRADFPADTLAEFVAYARANPGKVYYGSQGLGGGNHMAALLLAQHSGAIMNHVPFPGGAPATAAVAKGEVDFYMAPTAMALPWRADGKIKILAIGAKARSPDLPDVPTFRELGYPEDFVLTVWQLIAGPPGMSEATAEFLNRSLSEIMREPAVRELFAKQGIEAGGTSRAETRDWVARESALWARVAAENHFEKH
jgi:tripartite-type tricarboxylate transporter receptor subunit TctC